MLCKRYSTYIFDRLKVEVWFIYLRGDIEHEVLRQLLISSCKQLVEDVEVTLPVGTLSDTELLKKKRLKEDKQRIHGTWWWIYSCRGGRKWGEEALNVQWILSKKRHLSVSFSQCSMQARLINTPDEKKNYS